MIKTVWETLKAAVYNFLDDNMIVMAAALAFFAILSLAPLLLLLVTASAYIGVEYQHEIVARVHSALGNAAGNALEQLLYDARIGKAAANWSIAVDAAFVLLGGTIVFAHLQTSLNRAFNVKTKAGIVAAWFYKRVLSLLMVVVMGVLLLLSAVLTPLLSLFHQHIVSRGIDIIGTLMLFVLLFALMYKILPDVRISWKDVWVGGLITSGLFVTAEWLIAEYLARSITTSIYGAAGAVFVLLLWSYYSGIVVLFGAELTQAYTECCGTPVEPNRLAEWNEGKEKKCVPRTGPKQPPQDK